MSTSDEYVEIIFETNTRSADFIADALFSVGLSGVKIVDPADASILENKALVWDYISDFALPPTNYSVYVSGFVSVESKDEKIEQVKELLSELEDVDFSDLHITTKPYSNLDWENSWKDAFQTVIIGRFAVVPYWLDPPPSIKYPILIDPSMAFGNGQHVSTRLCFDHIGRYKLKDKIVLDIGTGSGVLGIASIIAGAKRAYMYDIDPLAIKSAKHNAELNGVSTKAIIEEGDLCSNFKTVADFVFANLTADLLIRLVDSIKVKLNLFGIFICSGIIMERAEEVARVYERKGFEIKSVRGAEGWVSFLMLG
ncbi:MAG: 50S ribosomal protein L11 methyltransferase [Christensenellaceae bacterium]|jgi:ribosomal protein L11 methyltransferase|nr:50S ribosomal protein L11 methyltransferase [Christensenellaceae bacterium]